jgi:hypothetical protein
MTMRQPLSRTSATALVALAVAVVSALASIGGPAFAGGDRTNSTAAALQRCANGAVRGIAVVTGDPRVGIANLPGRFTSSRAVFDRRFNCTGRAVQVRRLAIGVYEVRFVGNAAPTALAGGLGGGQASAERSGAGVFRVSVYPAGRADPEDRGFILVVV